MSIPFTLRDGQITILSQMLVVTMSQRGRTNYQSTAWRRLSGGNMKEIREELEPDLGDWKLVFE